MVMKNGHARIWTPRSPRKNSALVDGGRAYYCRPGEGERQRIEEVAERIVLLSDGAGQDVIDGFRTTSSMTPPETFAAIPNQYERALWLHVNEPVIFEEALNARQADVFRQSASRYSGFMAPANLFRYSTTRAAKAAFHQTVAQQLGCSDDAVAIQIFKRLRPDTQTGEDVDLYQISIHHNRPPEIIDCVQASELVPQEVIRRCLRTSLTSRPMGTWRCCRKIRRAGSVGAHRGGLPCCNRPSPARRSRRFYQYDYQSLAALRKFRPIRRAGCVRQGRRARLRRRQMAGRSCEDLDHGRR